MKFPEISHRFLVSCQLKIIGQVSVARQFGKSSPSFIQSSPIVIIIILILIKLAQHFKITQSINYLNKFCTKLKWFISIIFHKKPQKCQVTQAAKKFISIKSSPKSQKSANLLTLSKSEFTSSIFIGWAPTSLLLRE